ncbi:hypothetical protein [Acidilobus sp.]
MTGGRSWQAARQEVKLPLPSLPVPTEHYMNTCYIIFRASPGTW